MTSRVRNLCFTLNNYNDAMETELQALAVSHCKAMIYGKEVGESGTPHLQGYLELKVRTRFTTVKTAFPNGIHFEPRKGTRAQATNYCRKEDKNPFLHGDLPKGQGFRQDLVELKTAIKRGDNMLTLMDDHPAVWRHLPATRLYRQLQTHVNYREVEVHVLHGEAGTGKTRTVFEKHPNVYVVEFKKNAPLWFDGYDSQDVILFDDFYGEIGFSYMLRLLDGYRMNLPVKGGFTPKAWTKVYITSNEPSKDWYNDPHGSFARRITTEEFIPQYNERYDFL